MPLIVFFIVDLSINQKSVKVNSGRSKIVNWSPLNYDNVIVTLSFFSLSKEKDRGKKRKDSL